MALLVDLEDAVFELIAPPQHVALDGLDAAVVPDELLDAVLAHVLDHLERVLPIERRGVDEEACGRGYALLESWLVAGTLSALAHPSGPPRGRTHTGHRSALGI